MARSPDSLHLTGRICAELRLYLRAQDQSRMTVGRYDALRKIAAELDRETDKGGKRGGVWISMDAWDRDKLLVLRNAMLDTLTDCTQMQVRGALTTRVAQIDNHVGVSAVERLGRLG